MTKSVRNTKHFNRRNTKRNQKAKKEKSEKIIDFQLDRELSIKLPLRLRKKRLAIERNQIESIRRLLLVC